MKKSIFFLLLCAAGHYCPAQGSNDMTAHFKFQDAQAAFDNGDYNTTLSKLDETQKLLGSANPKILYLRIMAEYKSIDFTIDRPICRVYNNIPLLQSLKKDAATYMQQYAANAGEDKARDVYNINEEMKQYSDNENTYAGLQALKNNDTSAAFNAFTKAANTGDAEAMYQLGEVAEGKRNYTEAMQWYQKAADNGSGYAMNQIGNMYSDGTGVQKDKLLSVKWHQKAADNGIPVGMYNLASEYENGWGVQQNFAKALEWYQRAADKGFATGWTNIGEMYMEGEGVEKNREKAIELYKKAKEKGDNWLAPFRLKQSGVQE